MNLSSAVIWEPDNDLQGTILQPFKKVHVLEKNFPLTFKFDTSPLNFIVENSATILKNCPNNTLQMEIFKSELGELNTLWNRKTEYKLQSGLQLVEKPIVLEELVLLQESYVNNCSLLSNIQSITIETNKKLDNLLDFTGKLNLDTLNYFINLDEIQRHATANIDYYGDQFMVPFRYELFGSEFWKHIQLHSQFEDNFVFIEIEIPFYSKRETELFAVMPKPLVWAGEPYLYNKPQQYAIVDFSKPILYTELEYQSYCMLSLDKTFCKWTTHMNNSCYEIIFAIEGKKYDSKCFTRIKKTNVVTQVGSEIHFTVFSPLRVLVTNHQYEYSTILTTSMKITTPMESNVSTSFYQFNPKNATTYGIFYEQKPMFGHFLQRLNGTEQLKFLGLLVLALAFVFAILLIKEFGQQFLLFIALRDEIVSAHLETQAGRRTAVV